MAISSTPTGFKSDGNGDYILKDPNARKDYGVDWSLWLIAPDVIDGVQWIVEPGLTIENEANTDTKTFIEVSGGLPGKSYNCTARVTTVAGLIEDKSFRVVIRAS